MDLKNRGVLPNHLEAGKPTSLFASLQSLGMLMDFPLNSPHDLSPTTLLAVFSPFGPLTPPWAFLSVASPLTPNAQLPWLSVWLSSSATVSSYCSPLPQASQAFRCADPGGG